MPEVQKDRPSYVRFEKRPIEDREESIKNGYYTTKDVVYAIITPHGSTDEIPRQAEEWIASMRQQQQENRIPEEWVDRYENAYQKYLKGEETPLEGTPIKDWPPLSPSQRQNLIAINVLTVEDLAQLNESGIARIGLGGQSLKLKAQNWLAAANDVGKLAERITAMEVSQKQLREQNESQAKLISELRARNEALEKASVPAGAR